MGNGICPVSLGCTWKDLAMPIDLNSIMQLFSMFSGGQSPPQQQQYYPQQQYYAPQQQYYPQQYQQQYYPQQYQQNYQQQSAPNWYGQLGIPSQYDPYQGLNQSQITQLNQGYGPQPGYGPQQNYGPGHPNGFGAPPPPQNAPPTQTAPPPQQNTGDSFMQQLYNAMMGGPQYRNSSQGPSGTGSTWNYAVPTADPGGNYGQTFAQDRGRTQSVDNAGFSSTTDPTSTGTNYGTSPASGGSITNAFGASPTSSASTDPWSGVTGRKPEQSASWGGLWG